MQTGVWREFGREDKKILFESCCWWDSVRNTKNEINVQKSV